MSPVACHLLKCTWPFEDSTLNYSLPAITPQKECVVQITLQGAHYFYSQGTVGKEILLLK